MDSEKKKEEIHISYISAVCACAEVYYETQRHDQDSTDGILKKRITFPEGAVYDAQLRIQLKCTSSPSQYTDHGDSITYKLKVKNYNDLCTPSTTPIILGLLVLPEDESSWVNWSQSELLIKGCMYWADFSSCHKSDNSASVSVQLNKENIINPHTVLDILTKIAKEEWP